MKEVFPMNLVRICREITQYDNRKKKSIKLVRPHSTTSKTSQTDKIDITLSPPRSEAKRM